MADWAVMAFPVRSVDIMNTEVEISQGEWESYWPKEYEVC